MITERRRIQIVRDSFSHLDESADKHFTLPAEGAMMLSDWVRTLADALPQNRMTVWSVHEGDSDAAAVALICVDAQGRCRTELTVPDVQMRFFATGLVYCRYFYSTDLRTTPAKLKRAVSERLRLDLPYLSYQLLNMLEKLIGHYDRFSRVAAELDWKEAYLQTFDLSPAPPVGCMLYLIRFPKCFGMREAHIVQAMLMKLAAEEELAPDFWDIFPFERARLLKTGRSLYEQCVQFHDRRVMPLCANTVLRQMCWHLPAGTVIPAAAKKVIWDGLCCELGGCYSGDHSLICTAAQEILLIDHGIWD